MVTAVVGTTLEMLRAAEEGNSVGVCGELDRVALLAMIVGTALPLPEARRVETIDEGTWVGLEDATKVLTAVLAKTEDTIVLTTVGSGRSLISAVVSSELEALATTVKVVTSVGLGVASSEMKVLARKVDVPSSVGVDVTSTERVDEASSVGVGVASTERVDVASPVGVGVASSETADVFSSVAVADMVAVEVISSEAVAL